MAPNYCRYLDWTWKLYYIQVDSHFLRGFRSLYECIKLVHMMLVLVISHQKFALCCSLVIKMKL